MPDSAKIVIAMLALLIIGLWGVHGGGRPQVIEGAIEAAAFKALDGAGAEWAEPTANGQKIVLTGNAPSQAALDDVVARVKTAIGPGGVIAGGVSVVDASAVKVAAVADIENYAWRAERTKDEIRLSGFVPSAEAQRMIAESAKRQFSDLDVNDTAKIEGRPDEGVWLVGAATSLRALANLDSGMLINKGNKFSISGAAASQSNRENAVLVMEGIPHPLVVGDIDIETLADAGDSDPREEPSAPALVAASEPPKPAAQPPTTTEGPPPEELAASCQNALTQLLKASPIRFESSQHAIERRSRETLSEAASVLSKCGEIEIEIQGHTDSSGPRRSNEALSLRRAEAVADFLLEAGVENAAISARGLGAAEPIATNRTRSGRTRNRRIEIIIRAKDAD